MKSLCIFLLLLGADAWAEAVRAYRGGDFDRAWEHFQAELEQQAQPSTDLYWGMALTAMQRRDWSNCESALQHAVGTAQQSADAATIQSMKTRQDWLMAEMSWRRCASEVQALAPTQVKLEDVTAKHVQALQRALMRAEKATALWTAIETDAARRNQLLGEAKVVQLRQKLREWQQHLQKKNGTKPPQQSPDQLNPDAPPPPPDQSPPMTAQDQQDLLNKLAERQKKKVVLRRSKEQPGSGAKDW